MRVTSTLLLLLTGCSAAAPDVTGDLDTIQSGLANVRADVEANAFKIGRVETQVAANVTGLSYTSTLGVGATVLIGSTLVLNLWLSHRRGGQLRHRTVRRGAGRGYADLWDVRADRLRHRSVCGGADAE